MVGACGKRRILHTPSSLIISVSPISRVRDEVYIGVVGGQKRQLRTLQKDARKVDAHVGVPRGVGAGADGGRDVLRLNLVDINEDALAGAEADNDLRDAEEEGLDPVLHELAVEVLQVVGPADLYRRLELNPVDWGALLLWFGVPDLRCGEYFVCCCW